ncbi:F-box protein At1g61340-like [Nicotiana tabacum]|uniref:F-box protein At1g61340-like n=1 Tax=Nicotiana tabacum TaxID=4097 RepID=A0A1S4C2D9_TOBAC|nr:F-box protein At1g61340-like [Nicotiana tomentosiformis]XP_016495315.1 PREDICTED: F-box protein At1g61340-like [Nicotiana tabacum]
MAMRKKCEDNVGLAGLVRSTSFGRKRIFLPEIVDVDDFISTTPTKKLCRQNSFSSSVNVKSPLEVLPQDILIRIVCGVDHDDLKRLFHVSKAIREATVVAKKWHFEYNTPRKTVGFKNATTDMENWSESYESEAPNAPRQSKVPRSRLSRKKLADISVSLFTSDGEENWPRRELFMEMDTEM